MKNYCIEVVRRYYVCHEVEVEAKNPDEAFRKAEEISGNTDHTGKLQLEDVECSIVPRY